MEIVSYFGTLMKLAREQAIAEREYDQHPTEENHLAYMAAKRNHDTYKQLCLESDRMIVDGISLM